MAPRILLLAYHGGGSRSVMTMKTGMTANGSTMKMAEKATSEKRAISPITRRP